MREIPVFIASSIREFQTERKTLSLFFDMLNSVYKKMRVQLVWNRPETASRVMVLGGSQRTFDQYIEECEFFVLIVGQRVGEYTRHEVTLAVDRFRATGKPLILPCFLADTSPEAEAYRQELRQSNIGEQYIDPYENFDAVQNRVQWELTNYVVDHTRQGLLLSLRNVRQRGPVWRILRFAAACKIAALEVKILLLRQRKTAPSVIAEQTVAYEKLERLVRTYHVKPGALLDYMGFLWDQHMYDRAIEIGHWLENEYRNNDPGEYTWSVLYNRLGLCYDENNQHDEAEKYYTEELKIESRLAEANPTAYAPDVATTCNNLGNLLSDTNRMEDAERYYREALESYRRLAEGNPAAYAPYVATTCNNLGNLLKDTNRMEEAERYYREALEIRRRLAEGNPAAYAPDVAATVENLAILQKNTGRMKEAEQNYLETLEIRRKLAEANPGAYEPKVAQTCFNLGLFERDRGDTEAARRYFTEALTLNEKFPHRAKNAQRCRDALDLLDEPDFPEEP